MQTSMNIDSVRQQIMKKNNTVPYISNGTNVLSVITDQDHHPYSRYFRGVYYFPEPIVFEREAGWRPQQQNCYEMIVPYQADIQPTNCFEAACSTIYPCYSENSDTGLNKKTNHSCIVKYR